MTKIEETLAERGNRYGSFQHHARVAQRIQDCMREETGWGRLADDQKQALTVIADKIARMLAGDPGYRDNWHDIVGYAKLVDDRMAAEQVRGDAPVELPVPRYDEARMDVIGQNGNDGEHYPPTPAAPTWTSFKPGDFLPPPWAKVLFRRRNGSQSVVAEKVSEILWQSDSEEHQIVAYRLA